MPTYGTHSMADLLAVRNTTVLDFGEENLALQVQRSLDIHNGFVDDMTAGIMETTTDRHRSYGGTYNFDFDELDEFGTPDAQKGITGATLGFPLRRFGRSLQWTRSYFEMATVRDIALSIVGIQEGDVRRLEYEMKRAIFRPTNYSFIDKRVDRITLEVKALVNADSMEIPIGPTGGTFDAATHTHYLATASLTSANVKSLLSTVLEHHNAGQLRLYIPADLEDEIAAMTGANEFKPVVDARIVQASTATFATGGLDLNNPGDRMIGIFGAADVYVKPWMPTGYMFAFMFGGPAPLVLRRRSDRTGALRLVYEDETHPLRARVLEREYGIGVWNRTNGAVLYTGSGTYASPSLAA